MSFLLFFLFSDRVVVVVCRQIDRLYDWKKSPETDVVATLKKQKKNTKDEFDERAKAIILEFAQQVSIITSYYCFTYNHLNCCNLLLICSMITKKGFSVQVSILVHGKVLCGTKSECYNVCIM